jgi:hypothetical protein
MIRIALVLVTLLLGGCADPAMQGPVEDGSEAGVVSQAPEDSFSSLASVSPSSVEPGDSEVTVTIAADDEPLGSGTYFRIERWDGQAWQLQHYVRHGAVQPAGLGEFLDDGYGIEPGEMLSEEVPLDGLEAGVHRIGLEMWSGEGSPSGENRVEVYARLDVSADAGDTAGRPVGWTELPTPLLSPRWGPVVAWIDDQAVVVGGRDTPPCPPNASCVPPEEPALSDGAVYDAAEGTWRSAAEAPVPIEPHAHAVVWRDNIVMQGDAGLYRYSVSEDAWSSLPAPAGQILAAGDRLVAVGSTDEVQGQGDDWVLSGDGAAWTPLPPDPIGAAYDRQMVWTGDSLVLLASSLDGVQNPTFVQAARLTDPFGAAEWGLLPESTVLGGGGGWISTPWGVVSPTPGGADGGQVNGFGRTLPYSGVLRLDPPAWRELPPGRDVTSDVQLARTGRPSTDGRVLLGDGWVLDLSTGEWMAVPQNPAGSDQAGVGGAGTRLLQVGGGTYDQDHSEFTAVADAWLWTAPPGMGTGGDPTAVELPTPEPYERPQRGPGDPDGAIDCTDDDDLAETNFDSSGPGAGSPSDALQTGLAAAADIGNGDVVINNESYASVVSNGREVVTARAVELDDATWVIAQATACSRQLLDAVVSR